MVGRGNIMLQTTAYCSDIASCFQGHICAFLDIRFNSNLTPWCYRLIETLLPCFASLAGITKNKFRLLQQLLAATDPENDVSHNNKKAGANNDQIINFRKLF